MSIQAKTATAAAISTALAFIGCAPLFARVAHAAALFPLTDVRLLPGPFFEAQQTGLQYVLALDPDKLLAPYLREAGIASGKDSYGYWESSGLDGHLGGHYLSALALLSASTGYALSGHRASGLGTSIAVKFVAHAGSRAGGLYGLRLLR